MLNQIAQFLVAKHILVAPVGGREHAKHAIKRHGIGQLNLTHGADDGATNIYGALAHILPVATFGNHKAMLLWQRGKFLVTIRGGQGFLRLFVIHIADALEIQKWSDIFLEGILRHGSADDVASLEQEVV